MVYEILPKTYYENLCLAPNRAMEYNVELTRY